MNSLKKRLIALALLTCMAVTSFAGCSKDGDKKKSSGSDTSTSDETSGNNEPSKSTAANTTIDNGPIEYVTDENGNFISFPVQSGDAGTAGESNSSGLPLNGADPEKIDVSPIIIDDNGQPATEIVEVTESNGEKVTDNSGVPVTEYVTVTSPASSSGGSDYESKTSGNYVLWMDISKNDDFVFNGQFLKVTFEIKEDIPDGIYPITFKTDFSTIKGITQNPSKVIDGSISVGGQPKNADNSSNGEFTLYGDNISCKKGDTVDYYIYLDNNPGLAATLVWFYYDSNAMSVKAKSVKAAGEFAEVSNGLQTSN